MGVLKMSYYYGWQNYETWLAGLYLDDGKDWQNFVTELLGEEEDEEVTEAKKVEMLAEYLKDYIKVEADMAGLSDFLYTLLTNAISKINFTELATTFLATPFLDNCIPFLDDCTDEEIKEAFERVRELEEEAEANLMCWVCFGCLGGGSEEYYEEYYEEPEED